MPVNPTYPGVYIEEIPSGVRTIVGVATSITAFIGRTARGPVSKPGGPAPPTINSFGDFERLFGGLGVDYPMSYAVRDFFLNGGKQAVIVRLYLTSDANKGRANATQNALVLEAANPGKWGNKLTLAVTYDGIDANETGVDAHKALYERFGLDPVEDDNALFNLILTDESSGATEQIYNVTFKDTARRVDRVLAQESSLARVKGNIPGPDTARPLETDAQNPVSFAGGVDSDKGDSLYAADQHKQSEKTGLYALEKVDLFNLLCIPPDARNGDVPEDFYKNALQYCVNRRAMLVVDPDNAWGEADVIDTAKGIAWLDHLGLTGLNARNAALYLPRVVQADPLREGQQDTFVACGLVAGVMARTDVRRGVWKAPAGLDDGALNGTQGLQTNLTDDQNGALNPLGINCLRTFPIFGRVIWGARTMRGADQLADEYKYVPVRRLALFIEESLFRGTQWVVFEPNDEPLWAQIRLNVGAFMHNLFRQGAFQGSSPREAYFVKCDKETNPQNDIDRGIVNIHVGFAPLKPAEFVIIKLQQIAGQLEV